MNWIGFMMSLIVLWYLIVLARLEYNGQLCFLNALSLATQIKSDYSVAIKAKIELLHTVLTVNSFVIPYLNTPVVLAVCIWNACQVDNSIRQLLYNVTASLCVVIWGNVMIVVLFSVSVLVYLSATLINHQLSTLYRYVQLCKDPFTLNRVLQEYTDILVQVHQSNKLVKFVLGSVNFLAVPVISILLSVISTPYDGALIKCFAFTAAASYFVLLVSTAAFLASVHHKVIYLMPSSSQVNMNHLHWKLGSTPVCSVEINVCSQ